MLVQLKVHSKTIAISNVGGIFMQWSIQHLTHQVEQLLFGDFSNSLHPQLISIEEAIDCGKTRLTPSDYQFLTGALTLYRRQFLEAKQLFSHITSDNLSVECRYLYTACSIAAEFRTATQSDIPILLARLPELKATFPPHLFVFIAINASIQLRVFPKFTENLEQLLTTISLILPTLDHPIVVQSHYYIGLIYSDSFEASDLVLSNSLSCFTQAQKFNLFNFELFALLLVSELYKNLQLESEALRYYLKVANDPNYPNALPILRALTLLNIAIISINMNQLTTAEVYLHQLQQLLLTEKNAALSLWVDIVEFQIAVKRHQLSIDELEIIFQYLTKCYHEFGTNFIFSALEPTLFQLEADLAQLASPNQLDGVLSAHFAHLKFLQLHTPTKKHPISQVLKAIANTYVQMDQSELALTYFQSYQENLEAWHNSNLQQQMQIRHKQLNIQLQARERQYAQNIQRSLQAKHDFDALTHLYSRRQLDTIIQTFQLPQAYLLLDIDHFKLFNDTYGHLAGDDVLKQVADIIKSNLSENDFGFRYGGEEFLILSFNSTRDSLENLTKSLYAAFNQKQIAFPNAPHCSYITVSGGSFWNEHQLNFEQAFIETDNLLYTAKSEGRNQIKTNF